MKSFSMVFSFYRKSIVINKYNGQKTKYKINISQVIDTDDFIFDAKDEFYTLIFNPASSSKYFNNALNFLFFSNSI